MASRSELQRREIPASRRKGSWDGVLRIDYIVPFLFLVTVVVPFFIMMGRAPSPKYTNYTAVTGFFQQDDPATDADTFDFSTANLGLIIRAYDTDVDYDPDHKKTQWERFDHQIRQYNSDSGQKAKYKLFYLGRHGEGYHNVAESFYGTEAWDCFWSKKDGNETVRWADAHLTEAGIAQAQKAHDFWKTAISEGKIPTAEQYYTSPLTRCLSTASITFSGLDLPKAHPFIPTVKELFRETIGVHTCDRRSSKTYIQDKYPTYKFEEGFKEDDPLWTAELRETDDAQDKRSWTVLDDVFTHDQSTYISVTAHSGEIGSLLRVLGHRKFGLTTGQVIPVLVKAEIVEGTPQIPSDAPYTTVSTCAQPPARSTA